MLPPIGPAPTGTYNRQSLWWRHEKLHRSVLLDHSNRLGRYRRARDQLENMWINRADTATQTYLAVLQMSQPEDLNIFPGMTATVTLALGSSAAPESSILIPAIAVVAKPDGSSFVWEVDPKDMTVHQRDVQVGAILGSENIQIKDGLKGGETIAVAGVLKLQEGMKVRLWEKQ